MSSQLKIFTPERDQSDELVLSIAADRLVNSGKITVRPINPYLNRYWTSSYFNLISTNYKFNPVSIWHLPHEKKDGLLTLYDCIQKHNDLPPLQELYYMVHLEKKTEVHLIKDMIIKRLRRWGLWKN